MNFNLTQFHNNAFNHYLHYSETNNSLQDKKLDSGRIKVNHSLQGSFTRRFTSPRNKQEESTERYNLHDEKNSAASIISRERQINVLEMELKDSRIKLREKELLLNEAIKENLKLKDELILGKSIDNYDNMAKVQNYLKELLYEKNDCVNFVSSGQNTIKGLITDIKSIIEALIKERDDIENRYKNFFELHNKQVEINSKLKYTHKGDVQDDSQIYYKEL